jgi:colanic acid/amylovoran biosynthesis protein
LSHEPGANSLDTPAKVLRQVSECRIIVTGSYHAGVFGLAQGIPVVGIVQSAYYRQKFDGLADQFGAGCIVLAADDAKFSDKLRRAMDRLWEQADGLKPALLSAAQDQITAAQVNYAKLPELIRLLQIRQRS